MTMVGLMVGELTSCLVLTTFPLIAMLCLTCDPLTFLVAILNVLE